MRHDDVSGYCRGPTSLTDTSARNILSSKLTGLAWSGSFSMLLKSRPFQTVTIPSLDSMRLLAAKFWTAKVILFQSMDKGPQGLASTSCECHGWRESLGTRLWINHPDGPWGTPGENQGQQLAVSCLFLQLRWWSSIDFHISGIPIPLLQISPTKCPWEKASWCHLVGGLEHYIYIFFHILGMSSSQLTFIFFRGVGQPATFLGWLWGLAASRGRLAGTECLGIPDASHWFIQKIPYLEFNHIYFVDA